MAQHSLKGIADNLNLESRKALSHNESASPTGSTNTPSPLRARRDCLFELTRQERRIKMRTPRT